MKIEEVGIGGLISNLNYVYHTVVYSKDTRLNPPRKRRNGEADINYQ